LKRAAGGVILGNRREGGAYPLPSLRSLIEEIFKQQLEDFQNQDQKG
jgi:hypothetical protein